MSNFPLKRLVDALRKRFGGDIKVDNEVVGGIKRFSFYMVSPKFKSLSHLKRQDAVWEVIDGTLSREHALQVSAVLPLAPGEIEEFVDSLGAKK
jgi:stress-induced morphogen